MFPYQTLVNLLCVWCLIFNITFTFWIKLLGLAHHFFCIKQRFSLNIRWSKLLWFQNGLSSNFDTIVLWERPSRLKLTFTINGFALQGQTTEFGYNCLSLLLKGRFYSYLDIKPFWRWPTKNKLNWT